MKQTLFILIFYCALNGYAQLFDNDQNTALVKTGVGYVYNMQQDSAAIYIDSLEILMPLHPVVPLMKAMNVLWSSMPNVTEDSTFKIFTGHLYEAIRMAERIDGGRQEHPEAIFFEITARGLLAEYYADGDYYMKALTEAGKAYNLLRSVFQLTQENPEFYLPAGVYNYFREMYPKKHPSYKPLLWFFRSGDAKLGISQIKEACKTAVLTKVEAYIYLSYIYLRYEEIPELAQSYLLELCELYPNNHYVVSKYLESLEGGGDFDKAPLEMIDQLLSVDKVYYLRAGYMFKGLYEEKVNHTFSEAKLNYQKSIRLIDNGELGRDHILSLAHLGMSRIFMHEEDIDKSIYHAKEALSFSAIEETKQEAKAILYRLE
ncbi:MAG: hypothetical protein JXR03_06335 [Cyclobacteriaceae bacterium]